MDEVYKSSTMNSGKECPKKKRIFNKKYFIEELRDAGALKTKSVNGVEQMALRKVSKISVGLVVAAKGTKSFPDSIIAKWIGSKLTQLLERQFLMYDHLVKFLGAGIHEDDIEKWKNLLRSNEYVFPEENDGWSSIFGNETFLSFKIIPVKLLAKDFCLKEKGETGISLETEVMNKPNKSNKGKRASKSDIKNKGKVISKQSRYKDSKDSHSNESKQLHSDSKQLYHIDQDIENQEITSLNVEINKFQGSDDSKNHVCESDRENLKDEQKESSKDSLYKSVNNSNEVSNVGNNIFRDPKENSLQRLSIEYTDIVETYNVKGSDNLNSNEYSPENKEESLNQDVIEKFDENDSKHLSDREDVSLEIQYEERRSKENMLKKLPIDQSEEHSPKMAINDFDTDDRRAILKQDISIDKIENMEIESVPSNKPLSEVIIKKKRKKHVIQDDNISNNDINYKSFRVVILPEEDIQCSFCERITHTIDNCPERKRLKKMQNRTVWDRISIKRPRPKVLNDQNIISPKCLNEQNMNSTFSVLKCATGSKYLYKTKVEKATETFNSPKEVYFNAKSRVSSNSNVIKPFISNNSNAIKPFISNKWHKSMVSATNTISMKCDVEKKKKELLSKQIKELKELLNLFTNKKSDMSLEVKKMLLETIKSLQTSIDNIRQELNNNLDKKQSTSANNNSMVCKEKKEKEYDNAKIQNMIDGSIKGSNSLSNEILQKQSRTREQQLQNELEKEKYEQKTDNGYLPNILPSPENEPEKEKCVELMVDMASPASRQKSEDEYSLNLNLSPESLLDQSLDKNIINNTAE